MHSSKSIIFCVIAIIVLQSCNDLLNKPQPSDELSQNVTINNKGTVNGIRIKMYDQLHTWNFTALYMLGPDALADGFVERTGSGRLQGFIQNQLKSGMSDGFQYSDNSTYFVVYDLANEANTILNNIPEGVLSDEELNRYMGEAYFFRAFAYFYLANILGYMPGQTPNAGSGKDFNLSIILRTKPTTNVSDATNLKSRSTATKVYDRIRSDLKKSIDLLSNNTNAQNASVNYIKAPAAEALLARVNLYMRDYEGANKYAQDALNHSSARIAKKSEVSTMFDETVGNNPEAILLLDVNPTTEGHGSDSISGFTSTYWNSMMPSPHVLDLYSKNDVRKKAWFGPCYSDNAGKCESNSHTNVELEKWNGELGHQTDDVPYFRVSEMLLIETEARINEPSLGDPLAPINQLRTNRGISTLNTVTIDDVLDERQREFIGEGQRFFDLKRLGKDIKKAGGRPDIPFTNFRVLDNIPDDQLDINPNLKNNPGY